MTQLAAHLGYSRSRVFGLFKSEMGLSPERLPCNDCGLKKPRPCCATLNQSVTAIALETGFNSAAYFCTVFRRYLGVTPASYRTDFV